MRIELDFCTLHFFDGYVISYINEGEIVTFDKSSIITKTAVEFYGTSKFVYITNRVNSYSVDPSVYFDISKLKTLVGFAVVSKDYTAKSNAEIEKLFLNKPMEVFDVLEAHFLYFDICFQLKTNQIYFLNKCFVKYEFFQ